MPTIFRSDRQPEITPANALVWIVRRLLFGRAGELPPRWSMPFAACDDAIKLHVNKHGAGPRQSTSRAKPPDNGTMSGMIGHRAAGAPSRVVRLLAQSQSRAPAAAPQALQGCSPGDAYAGFLISCSRWNHRRCGLLGACGASGCGSPRAKACLSSITSIRRPERRSQVGIPSSFST
jgi:hypothetical protein